MTRRNAKDGNYGKRHGRPSSRNRVRIRRAKEIGGVWGLLLPTTDQLAEAGHLTLPHDEDGLQGREEHS